MFRKILFWVHLVFGLLAGLAIAVMCFTGAALSFEKDIIGWAERDARRVEPPAGSPARRTLAELLQATGAAKPEARIATVAVSRDAGAAVAVGLPGNINLYANPYTAEISEGQAPRTRAFMRTMTSWHTRLNFTLTPGRPTWGAKINSAANVIFVVLGVTGLVLWWPRVWNRLVLRPALWFVRGARGRARDWNWHNVIGFWCLPALLIMAGTGIVLSYRWANDLVFRVAGEAPPGTGNRPPNPGSSATPTPPSSSQPALGPDALLARAQQHIPRWEIITLRFNPPLKPLAAAQPAPAGGMASAVVRVENQWPSFAPTTLTLDAVSGDVRRSETFADLTAGQRARRWIRLLHTGEALRWPGQLIAGIACLGGCVLVWTGFAMAWRRFFRRRAN